MDHWCISSQTRDAIAVVSGDWCVSITEGSSTVYFVPNTSLYKVLRLWFPDASYYCPVPEVPLEMPTAIVDVPDLELSCKVRGYPNSGAVFKIYISILGSENAIYKRIVKTLSELVESHEYDFGLRWAIGGSKVLVASGTGGKRMVITKNRIRRFIYCAKRALV